MKIKIINDAHLRDEHKIVIGTIFDVVQCPKEYERNLSGVWIHNPKDLKGSLRILPQEYEVIESINDLLFKETYDRLI